MRSAFYIIAFLLIIIWGVGFFVYSLGAIIHLLLVIAVIFIVTRMVRRDSNQTRPEKSAHDPKSAPP